MNLDEYISSGVLYFDTPEELIGSLKNPKNNPKLQKGEFFPLYYDSNPKTLKMLDLLIKKYRPSIVVETGMGNGMSAKRILSAFKEYNLENSKLYSFDVDPIVASSTLTDDPQFNLILINSSKDFSKKMYEIGRIDLFYHDSDHSYENQIFEYNIAWEILRDGGILATDDTHLSQAFGYFCKRVGRTPLLLCDNGKYSGAIQK